MVTLPALDAEINAALRRSIEQFGVVVPVIYNRGVLQDGNNRMRISADLGIDCPRIDLDIDPESAALLAVELNTARRQMTPDVRRQIVASLSGFSNRAVATALGVSEPTVRRDRFSTASRDAVEEKRVGRDGRSRPASQKRDSTDRVIPPTEPGSPKNKREETRAASLNDRLQVFLGQTTVGLKFFLEDSDPVLLVKALDEDGVSRTATELQSIAASCRALSSRLKEAKNDA